MYLLFYQVRTSGNILKPKWKPNQQNPQITMTAIPKIGSLASRIGDEGREY